MLRKTGFKRKAGNHSPYILALGYAFYTTNLTRLRSSYVLIICVGTSPSGKAYVNYAPFQNESTQMRESFSFPDAHSTSAALWAKPVT